MRCSKQLLIFWLATAAGQLWQQQQQLGTGQLTGGRARRQDDLYLEHMYSHYLQQEGRYHAHPQENFGGFYSFTYQLKRVITTEDVSSRRHLLKFSLGTLKG
jgi:hypothetical protein